MIEKTRLKITVEFLIGSTSNLELSLSYRKHQHQHDGKVKPFQIVSDKIAHGFKHHINEITQGEIRNDQNQNDAAFSQYSLLAFGSFGQTVKITKKINFY